jgi:hypothetical protein
MYKRTCALNDCSNQFETDNKRKQHCCKAHSNLAQVRRYRAKHRKGGGGGGGNGGGGGENPTLFDTITPVNSREAFVPLPVIGH